ncbi:MAG: Gx transporter family protein [Oscillospiraceae bacterium]|nr:Gx transporter family protein [Oscillospiraceae bacterium]
MVKRITRAAVLTAVALTIFLVELQIPSPIPIPGVKLGLANIITVVSMFLLGPLETASILLVRILLGSIFSGQMMALLYSLAGGLCCYLVMLLLRRILTPKQIWVCSVFGAIAHNIGQITVAILITRTPALVSYLPVLMVSGILAGLFTGLCAQFAAAKLRVIFEKTNL